MSIHGASFDRAQRAYDNREHPDFYENESDASECDICIFMRFGGCAALGDTDETGDCPSFAD